MFFDWRKLAGWFSGETKRETKHMFMGFPLPVLPVTSTTQRATCSASTGSTGEFQAPSFLFERQRPPDFLGSSESASPEHCCSLRQSRCPKAAPDLDLLQRTGRRPGNARGPQPAPPQRLLLAISDIPTVQKSSGWNTACLPPFGQAGVQANPSRNWKPFWIIRKP